MQNIWMIHLLFQNELCRENSGDQSRSVEFVPIEQSGGENAILDTV